MEKETGIYAIKNSINNKVYIGSAISFKRRFRIHKCDLLKGRHNKRLQNFVNKYGFDVLWFEIIESVDKKEDLINREQFWINHYKSYISKNGFNICKIAGSTLSVKMPKSHRDASKKRMLGNKLSLNRNWSKEEKEKIGKRSKSMWGNNPEKKIEMGKKLSKQRKGKPQWLDKPHPLLGKKHPAKGQKRTKEFCELMRKQRLENNGMKGVKLSEKRKKDIGRFHSKAVILVDDNGNFIKEYESAKSASLDLNLTSGSVCRVCKGEYKHTKGYKFKYK